MNLDPYNKILAGLVSNEANDAAVAEALHRNILFLSSLTLPGAASHRREDPDEAERRKRDSGPAVLSLFPDEVAHHRTIAVLAVRFHLQTGGHISAEVLRRVLVGRGAPDKEVVQVLFAFDAAARERIDEATFRFWANELVDQARSVILAEALSNGLQALESKWEDPRSKILYSGPDDTIELVKRAISVPGMRQDSILGMPSGDIRAEKNQILAEVEAASAGDRPAGTVFSGFRVLDRVTRGCSPGDLVMVGAASGEGKTQFCHNWAWHAAVEQRRNVMVVTIETHRTQYRRRLLCRHTNKPGVGRVHGIPYDHIKSGQFADEAERDLFARVVADFCGNTAYGVIDVTQGSYGLTVEDLQDKSAAFQDRYGVPLHLIVVDETRLMGTRRSRRDRRDEMNDILRGVKTFATTFDNGRGLVVAAPHQIPRESRNNVKAEEGRFYTMRDFADTSEAEKSADVAVMLLRDDDLKKKHEVACSIVKCRDADADLTITNLFERYETSFLGNLAG